MWEERALMQNEEGITVTDEFTEELEATQG